MRFALAGTPRFASWVLRDLVELDRPPVLVISQPDRPCGRGRSILAPEAVRQAQDLGIDCLQTEDINCSEVRESLLAHGTSTLVVAAFGQILDQSLLDSLTCLNIHCSLLPMYRGPAPIERALASGEAFTGVSVMRVTEGIDQGPLAQQVRVSVSLSDDAGSLGRVLAFIGAAATGQVLDAISDGVVQWSDQTGASSYAPKLEEQDCVLDTTAGARQVHDRVRSLSPYVGARLSLDGVEAKAWRTWPYGEKNLAPVPRAATNVAGAPGRIAAAGEHLYLGCGEGVVEILEIQPVNRARMTAAAFMRGYEERLGVPGKSRRRRGDGTGQEG